MEGAEGEEEEEEGVREDGGEGGEEELRSLQTLQAVTVLGETLVGETLQTVTVLRAPRTKKKKAGPAFISLVVKASGVSGAGLGLFVAQDVPKGGYELRYGGPRVSFDHACAYCMQCGSWRRCGMDPGGRLSDDGKTYLSADGETTIARYANHAKGDRANFRIGKRFMLVSKHRMPAGEEVLFNYGPTYRFLPG